jgi:hypothetical protein
MRFSCIYTALINFCWNRKEIIKLKCIEFKSLCCLVESHMNQPDKVTVLYSLMSIASKRNFSLDCQTMWLGCWSQPWMHGPYMYICFLRIFMRVLNKVYRYSKYIFPLMLQIYLLSFIRVQLYQLHISKKIINGSENLLSYNTSQFSSFWTCTYEKLHKVKRIVFVFDKRWFI